MKNIGKVLDIAGPVLLVLMVLLMCGAFVYQISFGDPKAAREVCESFPAQEPVEAVFFHERNRYTIFVPTDEGLVERSLSSYSNVVYDVRVAKTRTGKYVEYHPGMKKGKCYIDVVIHLDTLSTFSGAGWNHGKAGVGQTVKITE